MANEIVEEQIQKLSSELGSEIPESACKSHPAKREPATMQGSEQGRPREEIEQRISDLQAKSQETRLEELYAILSCDDPARYRKKMAGMALPFNTRDKGYRIPTNEASRKYKFVPNKSPEEIRQALEEVNRRRMEKKRELTRESQQKYMKNRRILQRIHERQLQEHMVSFEPGDSRKRSHNRPSPLRPQPATELPSSRKEITWELLKDLTYDDLTTNHGDDDSFQPSKLVLEGDEEANTILRKLLEKNSPKGSPRSSRKAPLVLAAKPQPAGQRGDIIAAGIQGKDKMPPRRLARINKSLERQRPTKRDASSIYAYCVP